MHRQPAAALAALAVLTLISVIVPARAGDPVTGTVDVTTDNGYARLVFRFAHYVPAAIKLNFPIMVIHFKQAVAVSVDHLNEKAPDYISAARIDPDGMAVRIALKHEVKVDTIPADERFYVDLLPKSWQGVLPGLPKKVVESLVNRMRKAEHQLRRQQIADRESKPPTIRVRVGSQPTFIRYIFDLPNGSNVVPIRQDGKLSLEFNSPIKWDLTDAIADLPPTVSAINSNLNYDTTTVNFALKGKPTVRTFREGNGIAVDIGLNGAKTAKPSKATDASPALALPDTVPAKDDSTKGPSAGRADKAGASPLTDMKQPAPSPQGLAAAAAKIKARLAHPAPVKPAAPPPMPAPAKPAAMNEPAMPEARAPPHPSIAAVRAHDVAPAPKLAKPVLPKLAANPAPKVAPKLASAPKIATAKPSPPPPNPKAPIVAELHRDGDNLRVEFPFAVPTPAAVFRRADRLWLVFDSAAPIDLGALTRDPASGIRAAHFEHNKDGADIVRLTLSRPRLVSAVSDGPAWIVDIGDAVTVPAKALAIARTISGQNRASIAIPFSHPHAVHRLNDPVAGDRLIVVTALAPARGFIKPQQFVDLNVLSSAQGVVLRPLADDIVVNLSADKIVVGRPGGLTLSSTTVGQQQLATPFRAMPFDTQLWGFNRHANYENHQSKLILEAAMAPASKRRAARINLARFYLANGMAPEAKGVLQVALADERGANDITGTVLKSVANIMFDRPEAALKDLADPQVGNQLGAPVWRAMAYAQQGKWAEAHARFKDIDAALGALPIQLQRMALREELQAAIEVRDYNGADHTLNELETLGVPKDMKASVAVLVGRLDEGLDRNEDALTNFRAAAASHDKPAAAQARLREIELRYRIGDLKRKDVVDKLETLTTVWRGDETETEGLKLLAHLYIEEHRYRDAFHVMKVAMLAHPDSDITAQIEDEAAATFEKLFLGSASDSMPPIKALALFYDYRALTPIGRRGDEMIRKLADRLVSVDLLDQAAELLQHQVDKRLQGAARAQVATRLATIYLMDRKPDRALATLRATRSDGLSSELRDQRLLLEARALSETGRHDLALELIANIKSQQAMRLRADILWSAKRWTKAAAQIELLYGDNWRDSKPLSKTGRFDILRAAIGYALGNEPIDLARLRNRYAAKLEGTPDGHAFDVVSAPIGTSNNEFKSVARAITGIDTLDAFLADMRKRYPESVQSSANSAADKGQVPASAKKPAGTSPAAQPQAKTAAPESGAKTKNNGKPVASAKLPAASPPKSGPATTGSIP